MNDPLKIEPIVFESGQNLDLYLTDIAFSITIGNDLREILFSEKYGVEKYKFDSIIIWLNSFFEKNRSLISKQWRQIRLGIDTPEYVLIPEEYFNPDLIRNYLEEVTFLSEKKTCFTNVVNESGIRICFAIDNLILEYFQKNFKDIKFFHSEIIRQNFCFKQIPVSKKDGYIFLFFQNDRISFSIFEEKKILTNTSLPYISFEDILFQINRLIKLYFNDKPLPEISVFSDNENIQSKLKTYYPVSDNTIAYAHDFSMNIDTKLLYLCE